MRWRRASYGAIDAIITNPPFTRKSIPLLRRLIAHFQNIAPTWLLLRLGMASTEWMAPLLHHCSDIVVMPRLILIEGTKQQRKGQSCLVPVRHQPQGRPGTSQRPRQGRGDLLHSAPESASNAASLTSRSDPVRGSARRHASSRPIARGVTPSVTPAPNAAIEPSGSEVFRYVRHADVPPPMNPKGSIVVGLKRRAQN